MLRPESALGTVAAYKGSWTVAAVSISAISLLLMLHALSIVPPTQLLPWYVLTYLLVGIGMMLPNLKVVSSTTLITFGLPGLFMVVIWAMEAGYWGGLWLLGLPAWAIICQRWPRFTRRQRITQPSLFVLILAGASLMFVLSGFYVPNFSAFLLPLLPIVLLVSSQSYRLQPWRAAVEITLSVAVVATSLLLPDLGWGSPVGFAGGAVLAGVLMALWAGRHLDTSLFEQAKSAA